MSLASFLLLISAAAQGSPSVCAILHIMFVSAGFSALASVETMKGKHLTQVGMKCEQIYVRFVLV